MNHDGYLSLSGASQGFYREKGSKFYAFAYPVRHEEEIKERLDTLRKEYHDARHHCYAYVLKPLAGQEERFRASDDGEPTHSAGNPILGQIRSHELYDALVVVVRYFGGTKLGVGGLVHAYRTAAAAALEHGTVVSKIYEAMVEIRFSYAATSEVQQLLHQCQAEIVDQQFTESCYYQLRVSRSRLEAVTRQFAAIAGVELLQTF